MPKQESCRIAKQEKLTDTVFKLTLLSPFVSQTAKPGQFVNVRVCNDYDPLLRRPISIHQVSKKDKTIQLLYEVVGKGTEILSSLKTGTSIDILGPLGNGFPIDKNTKNHILVGGGMGIAPLLFLASQLKGNVEIIIGASSKSKIYCANEMRKLSDKLIITTDDGSLGEKGFVSDSLSTNITDYDLRYSVIYACGPHAMLEAVAHIARKNKVPCQLSMEAYMACGIGTCMGCVVKTVSGYKKVCDDGPVFDAKEIIWD
ncbi:MAG: dihydroorotate dehydrogenase electron transfer subunit [Candidatus Margulisiibacteriota bacterium]